MKTDELKCCIGQRFLTWDTEQRELEVSNIGGREDYRGDTVVDYGKTYCMTLQGGDGQRVKTKIN